MNLLKFLAEFALACLPWLVVLAVVLLLYAKFAP